MKKKMILILIICAIVLSAGVIAFVTFFSRENIHEYNKPVTTLNAKYSKNDNLYSFDLDVFKEDDIYYLSLNDFYNAYVLINQDGHVEVKEHQMVFSSANNTFSFDYVNSTLHTSTPLKENSFLTSIKDNDGYSLNKINKYFYIKEKELFIPLELSKILIENYEISIDSENKTATIQ